MSWFYYSFGSIRRDLGDLKIAQSDTEEALRLSQKNGEKSFEGLSWILLGRIFAQTEPHQFDRAADCILKGIEILRGLKIKAFYSQGHLFLGELYMNGGKPDKAKVSLQQAESMFQEMGMNYWLARTREVKKSFKI